MQFYKSDFFLKLDLRSRSALLSEVITEKIERVITTNIEKVIPKNIEKVIAKNIEKVVTEKKEKLYSFHNIYPMDG